MRANLKTILFFTSVLLFTTNLSLVYAEQDPRDLGFVNKYMIKNDGQSFEIIFVTNFLVSSYSFNHDDNLLQFDIETSLEEENIGGITIPRDLIDGKFVVSLNGKEIPYKLSDTSKTSVISVIINEKGKHTLSITTTDYVANGGGCLIATAAFDSELSPQVQFLREIRDGKVMTTQSGSAFMNGFNQFYYSFSPAIADYERENPTFKESLKIILTPLLLSLTLLNYVDIDSEYEILGYGIGIILLNIGMYFVVPAIIIMKIRKRVNIEKLNVNHV